jgi:hypothetical protein
VVLLLVLLMWRPAGALPSSTAGSTRSDCDELSVIGAPAPRSLLLVDVRSSTVLNGAYKRAFRYGPHKYPNASLEVSTGTSHDWWYERYDPVPVIGGLSGYLWRCRFAWQFTTGPPAPDAHTSLASRCAADASILLAATQAQPFSPSSATASTRCDALRTSDPNSVLRDQAVSVLNNETWWTMPVDHPRLVPIAVHANVTAAGLVDMSRNRTRGVAILCHSTLSCPTVTAVASDDTSQPFARRSNVLFNAMPVFDQYTATSGEGTPPTLTSSLLFCPALGTWARVTPSVLLESFNASTFPLAADTLQPLDIAQALKASGRHSHLSRAAIVSPGTFGGATDHVVIQSGRLQRLYDSACSSLRDERRVARYTFGAASLNLTAPFSMRLGSDADSSRTLRCSCASARDPLWPLSTLTRSTSLPAGSPGGEEANVPPLPRFWKWLSPAAFAALEDARTRIESSCRV